MSANETIDAITAQSSADEAVKALLAAWQQKSELPREAVALLCELATARDEAVQRIGVKALFPQVIERFNDSFTHTGCALYDQLFAQVISHCRALPEGAALDEMLNRFGLYQEEDFLARKARLLRGAHTLPTGKVRKIILLSRVTIGADVAINGTLFAALRERFPQAEFVWLGSTKLRELYGGTARVRVRELRYERGGGLLSRLQSWLTVVEAVAEEGRLCWQDDPQHEMLVIDADSRLTQLGLLPVIADDRQYYYFESRSYNSMSAASLARLTAQWANEVFGAQADAVPQVVLPAQHIALGKALRTRWCPADETLITVSWGVGGNARKRLNVEFEAALLSHLLKGVGLPKLKREQIKSMLPNEFLEHFLKEEETKPAIPACKILLDKGGDQAEQQQINELLEQLRAQGKRVLELNESNAAEMLNQNTFGAHVVTWDGGIGALAGLIAASDFYVGYDSAGQHLAAALATATLTIFVNDNAPLFAARWRATGGGPLAVLQINATDWEKGNVTAETLLPQAIQALNEFIASQQKEKAQE
jgi:ADP-heptose:LPS heptosyltransferase